MQPLTWILISLLMQQPPPSQAQAPDTGPPTFTARSSLVVVDVTVRDKNGNAIEGLKQSDFAVTEDGKPQKIAVFEYQNLSSDPEPPAVLSLSDQLVLPEAAKTSITTHSPGEIQYHGKRLLVFYFDFSSMAIP